MIWLLLKKNYQDLWKLNDVLGQVKFCNILVIWGTIWQLQILLPRSLRWQTTLDWDAKLARFASMAWSKALKSMILGLLDLAWLLSFLQPEWNLLNHLVTVLWPTMPSPFQQQFFFLLLPQHYGLVQTRKA